MKIPFHSPPPSPRAARTSKILQVNAEALPTDARIAQKAKLKQMKELGIKPKKRKQHVEEGHDDCGEDLSGLGDNIILYGCDCTSGWVEAHQVYNYPTASASSSSGAPLGPEIIPPNILEKLMK